jgi:Homeodomain-like domain
METNNDSIHKAQANRKDRAILALLEHGSTEKAAAAVGIHPATLWRWLKEPKFQQALREARREAFSRAIARLQQVASTAVATLESILNDRDAPAGSRVRAAQCVIELGQKGFATEDIEMRVAQLEQLAEQSSRND